MEVEIGKNAGRIWHVLEKSGPQTQTALAKKLNLKPVDLNRAVGWLAREGKLCEVKQKRGTAKLALFSKE